jgi:hypothetical protein
MTNDSTIPKPWSRRNRERLLAVATFLDRLADRIRMFCNARTPRRPRRPRKAKEYAPEFAQRGTIAIEVNLPPRLEVGRSPAQGESCDWPRDGDGREVEV